MFEESKAGVRGLVEAGITRIPRMFYCDTPQNPTSGCNFSIPIIDLKGMHTEVVNRIQKASEECGFFQVINHGIPVDLLERMIDGVRCFNEQDVEVWRQFYTRDNTKF